MSDNKTIMDIILPEIKISHIQSHTINNNFDIIKSYQQYKDYSDKLTDIESQSLKLEKKIPIINNKIIEHNISNYIHPDDMSNVIFRFNKISKIRTKTLLKKIYRNASLIINNINNTTSVLTILLSPHKMKTFAKASKSQFYKVIIAYIYYIINTYTFSKHYGKELFIIKRQFELCINMTILFAYSKNDYSLFDISKSYEQYLYESLIHMPTYIINKKIKYILTYYNHYDFNEELMKCLTKYFGLNNINYYNHIKTLQNDNYLNKTSIMSKRTDELDYNVYIYDNNNKDNSLILHMDAFSKKIIY